MERPRPHQAHVPFKDIIQISGSSSNVRVASRKNLDERFTISPGSFTPEGGRHGEADDGNEGRNHAHDSGSIQEGHQEGKGPHARPCCGSCRVQQGLCLLPASVVLCGLSPTGTMPDLVSWRWTWSPTREATPNGEYALTLNLTDVSSGWTKTEGGQKQGPEVGFRGTGADSKQIALPSARPGLGQ